MSRIKKSLVKTRLFFDSLFGIYGWFLVTVCGIRTAGEALFCYRPKKYPKKAATTTTPLKEAQGYPSIQHSHHAVKKLVKDAQTVFTESP
jgi:hypothetical protein